MHIQVDMFAVELGAAILLQFETEDGIVRVLADAGEAKYHVNSRIGASISSFGNTELRINLLVGTHYDADHLDGLVEIIKNPKITIDEAWLPPVANDTEPHIDTDRPDSDDLLPLQFAREDGHRILSRYLENKAALCIRLAQMERRADEPRGIRREADDHLEVVPSFKEFKSLGLEGFHHDLDQQIERFFHAHVTDADRTIGIHSLSHADEPSLDPSETIEIANTILSETSSHEIADLDYLSMLWKGPRADRANVEAQTIAMIRRSTAKGAITAKSLAAVVNALKARRINIRCATIADGQPRRFHWSPSTRRFSPTERSASGPELLLLGPSDGLVKKFWDQLPIGTYALMAARSALPIRSITASNQLSYVMILAHAGQRLLIAGDAGCVDFSPGRNKPYYQPLIDALAPLHIVQVAHHAGNNAHFYRCLLASGFSTQEALAYLLLSHATNDSKRPSDLFSKFIELLGKNSKEIQLLFTSHPIEAKVRDIKSLIAPVVGQKADHGDVRIEFDGSHWRVTEHAVAAR